MKRYHNPFFSGSKIFLGSLSFFTITLVWVFLSPRQIFWSLDEGGKYLYLQSILQTGRVDTPLLYPARALDPGLQWVPLYYFIQRGDELHSWWPIALPLVSLPFYRIFGWLGLFLLPALAGAISAGLTGVLVRRLTQSETWGMVALVLTGLATPVAFYATRFWEHTLSTAGVLGALLGMLDADERGRIRSAVLAGISGSLAVFFRPDAAFLLIGFGLVLLVRRPRLGLVTAISALVVSVPWMALNQWTAGNPFGPTFGKLVEAEALSGWQKAGLKLLAYALFNPPRVDGFIFPRWALWTASLSLLVGVALAFFPRLRWLSLSALGVVIGVCAWVAFQPSWYQAVHGFVLAAPQVLFVVYAVLNRRMWKEQPFFMGALVAATGVYAAVYLWRAWVGAGGLQWGPRYLLSFYPLFLSAVLVDLHGRRSSASSNLTLRLHTGLLVFACLVGLTISLRGWVTARTLTQYYAAGREFILGLDAPVVVPWQGYVMDVPDLYLSGKVVSFLPGDARQSAWEDHLRGLGVDHYFIAELVTVDNAPLEVIAERLKAYPEGVALTRIDLLGGQ